LDFTRISLVVIESLSFILIIMSRQRLIELHYKITIC
jgi:hypothetical protein